MEPNYGDWSKLHHVWYRRTRVWDMDWPDGHPRHSLLVPCPFGGPIAVLRDASRGDVASPKKMVTPELVIYTAAGRLAGQTSWSFGYQLILMDWAEHEHLVCVFPSGIVRVFSAIAQLLHSYTIDPRIKADSRIIAATLSKSAIVVLTGSMRLYANIGITSSCCVRLADTLFHSPPHALKIIHGSSKPDDFFVLVASESGPLYLVDQVSCEQLPTTEGPFLALVTSPSRQLLAAVSHQNVVVILSSSNRFKSHMDMTTLPFSQTAQHRSIAWVGEDCLAVYHSGEHDATTSMVYVGGPGNQWIPYMFPEAALGLISEVDGVRIFGLSECHFIERVAESTVAALAAESSRPAALLLSAWQQIQEKRASANGTLDAVQPHLVEAILDCCEAASRERDVKTMRRLLEAAAFGRSLLHEGMEPSNDTLRRRCSRAYMSACRDLRVCLALHGPPVEMPLTISQYRRLGPDGLLKILSNRYMHLLALRIGEFLGLGAMEHSVEKIYDPITEDYFLKDFLGICGDSWHPPGLLSIQESTDTTRLPGVALSVSERPRARWSPATVLGSPQLKNGRSSPMSYVLEQWAAAKINACPTEPDQSLLRSICSTLSQYAYLKPSMVYIAMAASQYDRPDLAAALLQFEPRSRVQVRILLRLGELDMALEQAVTNGDPDLIYECLVALEQGDDSTHRFLKAFKTFPLLWKYYEILCYRSDRLSQFQRLYEADGALESAAYVCLANGLRGSPLEWDTTKLAHAAALFGSSASYKSKSQAPCKTLQKLTTEHVELLEFQKEIEQRAERKTSTTPSERPLKLRGLSLGETLKQLYCTSRRDAEHLEKLFDVPPQRALRLHIQALLQTGRIEELVALGQSSANQALLGGTDYFIKMLKRSPDTMTVQRLLPTLTKAASVTRPWIPRVFLPSDDGLSLPRGFLAGRQSPDASAATTRGPTSSLLESLRGVLSYCFGRCDVAIVSGARGCGQETPIVLTQRALFKLYTHTTCTLSLEAMQQRDILNRFLFMCHATVNDYGHCGVDHTEEQASLSLSSS